MNGNEPKRRWPRWLARVGPLLCAACVGCVCSGGLRLPPDRCADISKGAIPQPNGTPVRSFQWAQSHKAEADDFVIYKHEWYLGGRNLGPYGVYHLNLILKRLPTVEFPVLIEAVPDAALNEARKLFVIGRLAVAGFPDAHERVIVGFPAAEGLYGEEAQRIYRSLLLPQFQGVGGVFGPGYRGSLGPSVAAPGFSTPGGGSLGIVAPTPGFGPGSLP